MKEDSRFKIQDARSKSVALLWDESFLWGVMAYRALKAAGLDFTLIRSDDIRSGLLDRYSAVFVPGGWASNKLKSLGEDGTDAIREFVQAGGTYIGFCGGAGLATMDGIGLVSVKRRPTKERVPSFSGRIRLNIAEHPIWDGINDTLRSPNPAIGKLRTPNLELLAVDSGPVFNAWWPSQFTIEDGGINVLATYAEAMSDAFSSDINVGDAEAAGLWQDLERIYGINLNPERLYGEPAVVEGRSGKGRVFLSLIHFDTPGDQKGTVVLRNIWRYIGCGGMPEKTVAPALGVYDTSSSERDAVAGLELLVSDLIEFGIRNFLWYWRNPMLLQWRRGVRGLEYCTLYVMVKELASLCRIDSRISDTVISDHLHRIYDRVMLFSNKARRLLLLERLAMQNGHITYERCDDPEVQALREELFSRTKSHGGLFKEVIDDIDNLLFNLLSHEEGE